MHRINRSKGPSVRQMLNMAENLRDKSGEYSVVEISHSAHYAPNSSYIEFIIYTESRAHLKFKTWKECQDKYFELVK